MTRLLAAMRLARTSPVLMLLVVLAGCGGNDIDVDSTEEEIAVGVERSTATEDVQIDCPEVEKKQDSVFECDLTAAGGVRAKVKVTQLDDSGDKIRWEVNP